MSHSIVKNFKFVSLDGAHAGLVCALALTACSNVSPRTYSWYAFAVSESIGVARAIVCDERKAGAFGWNGDALEEARCVAFSKVTHPDQREALERLIRGMSDERVQSAETIVAIVACNLRKSNYESDERFAERLPRAQAHCLALTALAGGSTNLAAGTSAALPAFPVGAVLRGTFPGLSNYRVIGAVIGAVELRRNTSREVSATSGKTTVILKGFKLSMLAGFVPFVALAPVAAPAERVEEQLEFEMFA